MIQHLIANTTTINSHSVSEPAILSSGVIVIAFVRYTTPIVITNNFYELYLATSTDGGVTWNLLPTGEYSDSYTNTESYDYTRVVAASQDSFYVVWKRYKNPNHEIAVYFNLQLPINLQFVAARNDVLTPILFQKNQTFRSSDSLLLLEGI